MLSIAVGLVGMLAGADVALDNSAVESDPVIVTGRREHKKSISSATKTDTPLIDVPQSVSVVDAQQIAERGLQSITDVLRTVPGATVASGEGHRDQIILRGQNTTADFFVDGIRDDVQYYRGLYNLDRVEVLKGSNAMIFGRGGGGGVVNRVTKKADGRTIADGALSLDSHGAWSAAADLAAPLSGQVAGRLNAAYETFDSYRDHVDGRRIGINPTVGVDLGERTHVDLSYEYANDRRTTDRGIPSRDGRPLADARDDYFGDPDVNRLTFDAHVGDLAIDHRFSDSLRWSAKGRIGHYDKFYRNALAATPVGDDGLVGMEAYQSRTRRSSQFVQNDLVADLTTGPVRHTLLVGSDFSHQDTFANRQQGFFDDNGGVQRLFVDADSADQLPQITFRDGAAHRATAADTDARAFGLYVQDQAKIGDHVEIIAGLRRDWFRLDYADRLSPTTLTRKDSTWSPRVGVVVKPVPTLSLYASWSKSFLPQSGDQFTSLTATTASLAPEQFRNREVGVKWAATPAIDLSLAAYILDRTNTRATDPLTLLTVLTGAQRSKGIEASAQGRLSDRLSFSASAALQEAKIRKDTAASPAGRSVPNVPRFTSSLWGRYDVTNRLGFGAGLYHQSKAYGSIANTVVVPGYTRLDAAAFIGLTDRVALQVNVENLLDKYYIGVAQGDNNLTPGAPRSARATIRFSL